MPSPGEDIQAWSATAISNGAADPLIDWHEGQSRASVNNSARSEMAAHAKNRNLLNGSIVTTGTKNAQAFISGVGYTSIPTGLRATLKVGAGLTNDASLTLNMDGIGDVLVKTASGDNMLGGEFVGDGYVDLLYNGTNWIFLYGREFMFDRITSGGGIIIGHQLFTASGSYTPTPGMECCLIECIGGGGGGGGASGQPNCTFLGGGGGSGGYSRKYATAADIGASQTVSIGAGGNGGSGATQGGTGGTTSVGSLCVANGGGGGSPSYSAAGPNAGTGAPVGIGDFVCAGTPGGGGFWNTVTGSAWSLDSNGAPGPFGGGARTLIANAGQQGLGAGGGGSGGSAHSDFVVSNGGAGSAGTVMVTEFAGKGAPGRDGTDGAPGAAGPVGPAGPAGAGTGDVLHSGTPSAGQYAQWTDTSHITGVAAPFSTGDIKATIKTTPDTGWVMMDDRTIGDATSGATNRANADCVNLFTLLWTNTTNANCPVTPGGRGATAAADWGAHKAIQLPRSLGRALSSADGGAGLAGSGLTLRGLGNSTGEETHQLTLAELAAHAHGVNENPHLHTFAGSGLNQQNSYFTVDPGSTANVSVWNSYQSNTNFASTGISIQNAGSNSAHNNMQPSWFVNFMIKL